jgi:hypothetical protein
MRKCGEPIVHVLGLPAPATVGSIRTLELLGLISFDIWDPDLVEPTMPPLPVTEYFPAMMVASWGYSRTFKKNHTGKLT